MKRFTKTLVVAAVAVATVAAILVGCKKEQEENTHPNTDNARSEPDMTPTEQKVMDFLAEYDALLKGEKTEGEPVCIEEARWYWLCKQPTQSIWIQTRIITTATTKRKSSTGELACLILTLISSNTSSMFCTPHAFGGVIADYTPHLSMMTTIIKKQNGSKGLMH